MKSARWRIKISGVTKLVIIGDCVGWIPLEIIY